MSIFDIDAQYKEFIRPLITYCMLLGGLEVFLSKVE
jgi:hypothetical protein